ncbi:unnamed protein product [Merluccius merluccius]
MWRAVGRGSERRKRLGEGDVADGGGGEEKGMVGFEENEATRMDVRSRPGFNRMGGAARCALCVTVTPPPRTPAPRPEERFTAVRLSSCHLPNRAVVPGSQWEEVVMSS